MMSFGSRMDCSMKQQARRKHKMTGEGPSEWPTLTLPPPTSVLRLKRTSWYMSDHYICLQYLLFLCTFTNARIGVSVPIGVARIFQMGVTLYQSESTRLFGYFQAKTSWHFRHLF